MQRHIQLNIYTLLHLEHLLSLQEDLSIQTFAFFAKKFLILKSSELLFGSLRAFCAVL